MSEWTFTCRVQAPTLEVYTACRFTYFDYAGGRLTDSNEEDPEFDRIVEEATTVLGLLDGRKTYELMKEAKNFSVDTFLKKDLPSIVKRMRKSTVPIHFVISKWDLIEDEFSLKQVRERLLKIPEFQELIRMRNAANSPVRLIPVSSIGSGFAIPQPDGGMKKISGAVPRPFQLEAPLACVLPDGLQARISALQKKQGEIEKMPIGTQNVFSGIISVFGRTSQTVLDVFGALAFLLPDEYQFARPVVTVLSRGLSYGVGKHEQSLAERAEKLKQEREASLKLVKDEASSLQHAVYNFAVIENKLMRNFPESELILT